MKNETIRKINLYFNVLIGCAIIVETSIRTYARLYAFYEINSFGTPSYWELLEYIGNNIIAYLPVLIPFALTFWWQKKAPLESAKSGLLFNTFVLCIYGSVLLAILTATGGDGLGVSLYVEIIFLLHIGSMILIGIAALVRRNSKTHHEDQKPL